MVKKITLKAVTGPGKGCEFIASEPSVCIIGRASDCTISIQNDDAVAKHHALIDFNAPILTLEDLKTINGTILNGFDISKEEAPLLLHDGDRILIGATMFSLGIEGFSPESLSSTILDPSNINAESPKVEVRSIEPIKEIAGYDVVSVLGQGAGGAVYLVEDPETKQQLALKTMLPEIAVDVEHKARFIREGKSMELLSHKHIVSILGAGVSNGLFYFTLEYCNEGNLETLLKTSPSPIPYQKAVEITLQILDGLDYLHNVDVPDLHLDDGSFGSAKGLVHRDIKPGNILLDITPDGKVAKIADFGLAKAFNLAGLRGLTKTGAVGGTMDFVCRQQILNYKYAKPEVDVWSTIAVLYYLLTGVPPRALYKIHHTLAAILEADPVSLAKKRPDLPAGLIELVDFALDDRVELAYKTAISLREDLERYR